MSRTYQQAVEQTITCAEQFNQIVNGTATAEIVVEDGSKIPSIRKSLIDNFYFKDPLPWSQGSTETVYNQLRKFTDGSWWYAPNATASFPISMGVTPVGDVNWILYSLDATSKLTPQIREALRRSYVEAGYNLVLGSFEAGGILQTQTDVLLNEKNGKAYNWAGIYPSGGYIVPPNTDPSTNQNFIDCSTASFSSSVSSTNSGEISNSTTLADIRDICRRDSAGYILVGNSTTGCTVTAKNQSVVRLSDSTEWSWVGSLPKTVSANDNSVGSSGWVNVTGTSAVNPLPDADNTGVSDSTAYFNSKILEVHNSGGGVIKPISGTYLIGGSILLPSSVFLDLRGCTLIGNGSNIIVKSGAVISGVLTDITSEHGSGAQGAGTNCVAAAGIIGGTLGNAAIGIRGHRFNYGTTIVGTVFSASLGKSWYTTHSWGLKVEQCLVYSSAVMEDFVDWTEVCGNSFEGSNSSIPTIALLINGNFGGSYSLNIHNNGFHHWASGIAINCESDNTVITSNHFEDVVYHVSGNALTKTGFRIKNNWMKANLSIPQATVIPISFQALTNSEVGPNYYSTDGFSNFSAKVDLNTSSCFGNDVWTEYSPSNSTPPDLSMYQVTPANSIRFRSGSNDSTIVHPSIMELAGTSGLTFEKYKSNYHSVPNNIPHCTTNYSGTSATIDTWIASSPIGSEKMAAFNFKCVGTTSVVISGFICMGNVSIVAKKDSYSGVDMPGVSVTTSNNSGRMRVTVSGLASGGYITGWIKEM